MNLAKPLAIAVPGRRATKRIRFTKAAVESLRASDSRFYVRDTEAPGLCVAVDPTGGKVFYLYRWMHNAPYRIQIGAFPAVTVEDARKRAAILNGEIAAGQNPHRAKRVARGTMTFGELFATYMKVHAKEHKRTWDEDERQYERHLTGWASRPLEHIDRREVKRLHSKLGRESGKYAANRVVALVRKVFNLGIDDLGLDMLNPAARPKMFEEQSVERYVTPAEMPRFLAALDAEPDIDTKDAVGLALWTGARRGNILGMRWDAIDLPAGKWTIPGSQHKTKKTVTLALVEPALTILRRRRESDPNGEWVFPSHGKTGHLVEIKREWDKLRKRAGMPDLRLHDLRHTAVTWMLAGGASLAVAGRAVGHASLATTAKYSHIDLGPVREAMAAATAAMLTPASKG